MNTPMDVLLALKNKHSGMPRSELFLLFQKQIHAKDSLQRAVDYYYFTSMLTALDTAPRKKHNLELSAEVSRTVKVVRNRVLMDTILPSGKKLKHATFAECEFAGGWFSEIAKMGAPRQIVGKTISEQDLPEPLDNSK